MLEALNEKALSIVRKEMDKIERSYLIIC